MSFSARHLFAVLLTLLSLPTLLCAQTAPKDSTRPARGSISGRVTIKEKGVFGVAVALRNFDPPNLNERIPRAMTDQDGFYRIANLAPGTYEVAPSAPAFVPSDARESRGKTVLLGDDENVENINFTLVRGGVITGRVTDADGRPVIAQQVSIYRAEAFEPRRGQQPPPQIFPTGSAPTDDRGIYRVFGLMPGRYKVAAGRGDNVFGGATSAMRSAYTQVFHPDVTDQTKAAVIEVGEGTEAANVDITLGRALQTFTMSGRVVDGENGLPVPNVRLGLQRQAGQRFETVNTVSMSNNQGDFFATGLIAGKYKVVVFAPDNSGMRTESLTIDIIDQDVSGVTVKLVPGATLSGVVVFENDNGAMLAKFPSLELRTVVTGANGASMGPVATSPIAPNGSFQLTGLPAGLANLMLGSRPSSALPKGLSIARVEREGVVIPRGIPIQEREQLTGVRVVLSYGTATIRGVVELENGTLPQGARIFVSLVKQGERGGNLRPPAVDARGRFLIEGLSAGTYEIQATIAGVPQNMVRRAKREITVQDGVTTELTLSIDMSEPRQP